ncbi:methyltransferase-like protein 27 [Styela clava]
MDNQAKLVWEKCNTVYNKCDGEKALMKAYDEWATEYDRDLDVLNYSSPNQASQCALKYLGCGESTKILDVACGTGLVGEFLRKNNFKGLLHGIDGSAEMLNVARKKVIYDDLFTQFILPGKPIMPSPSLKYDGVMCVGAITKNHLDPKVLEDFLNVLIPEGIILFVLSKSRINVDVAKTVDEVLKCLINSGKIEELEVRSIESAFQIEDDDVPNNIQIETSASNHIYCYKKK